MYTQKELEVLNDLAINIFGRPFNELDQSDQDDLYLFGIATAEYKGYFDER